MEGEIVLSSKRKWLWAGIVLCLVTPPLPILVFGIALLVLEKRYRRSALAIIALSLVLFFVYFAGISWYLRQNGYLNPRVETTTPSSLGATATTSATAR